MFLKGFPHFLHNCNIILGTEPPTVPLFCHISNKCIPHPQRPPPEETPLESLNQSPLPLSDLSGRSVPWLGDFPRTHFCSLAFWTVCCPGNFPLCSRSHRRNRGIVLFPQLFITFGISVKGIYLSMNTVF